MGGPRGSRSRPDCRNRAGRLLPAPHLRGWGSQRPRCRRRSCRRDARGSAEREEQSSSNSLGLGKWLDLTEPQLPRLTVGAPLLCSASSALTGRRPGRGGSVPATSHAPPANPGRWRRELYQTASAPGTRKRPLKGGGVSPRDRAEQWKEPCACPRACVRTCVCTCVCAFVCVWKERREANSQRCKG